MGIWGQREWLDPGPEIGVGLLYWRNSTEGCVVEAGGRQMVGVDEAREMRGAIRTLAFTYRKGEYWPLVQMIYLIGAWRGLRLTWLLRTDCWWAGWVPVRRLWTQSRRAIAWNLGETGVDPALLSPDDWVCFHVFTSPCLQIPYNTRNLLNTKTTFRSYNLWLVKEEKWLKETVI